MPAIADDSKVVPTWRCATEVKSASETTVRVEDFLVLEMRVPDGFVKKAFNTSRGPAIAELRIQKSSDGKIEIFPKLKFGMDRIPSASLPAKISHSKNGQMSAEANLMIPADPQNSSLEVKLFCASSVKP